MIPRDVVQSLETHQTRLRDRYRTLPELTGPGPEPCDARRVLPAVRAALICERVLTETDGVLSAIRIISRIELPPGATLEATLLLMLTNVDPEPTPDHQILMILETGEGDRLGRQHFPIRSPAEVGAPFSLVLPFRFQAPAQARTFWLRVAYDTEEQLLTRVPILLRSHPGVTE